VSKDVFISYSSQDQSVANEVCELVELGGLSCWIAPRDVTPGALWDEALLDAIDDCQAFLLILSTNANASRFVKNKVNRAFTKGKAIFTFRVEDVAPGRSLQLYLASHQWMDGFPPPVRDRIDRITSAIAALLGKTAATREMQQAAIGSTKGSTSVTPSRGDGSCCATAKTGRIGVFRVVEFDRWPYEGVQSMGEDELDAPIQTTTNLLRGTKYRCFPGRSNQSIEWGLLSHNINGGMVEDEDGNALVSTEVALPSELWVQIEYRVFHSTRRRDDIRITAFRNHLMACGCRAPGPLSEVLPSEAKIGTASDPYFQWYEMGEPPEGSTTYAFVSSIGDIPYINAHTIPPDADYQLVLASVVDLKKYERVPSYRLLLTHFAELEQWYLQCDGEVGR
jgi:hypothetical protein